MLDMRLPLGPPEVPAPLGVSVIHQLWALPQAASAAHLIVNTHRVPSALPLPLPLSTWGNQTLDFPPSDAEDTQKQPIYISRVERQALPKPYV